jgi:hypothetical protein
MVQELEQPIDKLGFIRRLCVTYYSLIGLEGKAALSRYGRISLSAKS